MRSYFTNHKTRLIALILVNLILAYPVATAFWSSETAIPTSLSSNSNPPTVEDVTGETYPGVMIELDLKGADPDDDAVIYQIFDTPSKGTAQINGSKLQYTPSDDKSGTEKFSYIAVDPAGNKSEAGTIKIKIKKNKANFTYADMENHPAHFSALQLADKNIFVGEKIGTAYFFHPNKPVSRSEFIAMTASAADINISPTAQTDFIDNEGLSNWVKPYISAAAAQGIVSGYMTASGYCEIRGNNPITLAEANVVLSNLIDTQTNSPVLVMSCNTDTTPEWARNASAVLSAANILPEHLLSAAGDTTITRADACQLLSAALPKIK